MAQARNIIIVTDVYRLRYKDCMVKNDCFCSLRIRKDLDKKFKLCDGHISSLGHLCF